MAAAIGDVEIKVGENDHHKEQQIRKGSAFTGLVLLVGNADDVIGNSHGVIAPLGQKDDEIGLSTGGGKTVGMLENGDGVSGEAKAAVSVIADQTRIAACKRANINSPRM